MSTYFYSVFAIVTLGFQLLGAAGQPVVEVDPNGSDVVMVDSAALVEGTVADAESSTALVMADGWEAVEIDALLAAEAYAASQNWTGGGGSKPLVK